MCVDRPMIVRGPPERESSTPVRPDDAAAMREILQRDQRTTRHHQVHAQREQQQQQQQQHQQQQQTQQTQQQTASAVQGLFSRPPVRECLGDSKTKCCGVDDQASAPSCVTDRTQDKPALVNTYSKVSEASRDIERCDKPEQRLALARARFHGACTTWLRLGSLLVALLAVTVNAAPTTMSLEDRRLSSPPKWLNPCGFAAEEFDSGLDVVQLNDETLLGNIIMQAKTALNYAQSFRDDYIRRTFNTDYVDLHLTWKGNHYDWLPSREQIPKQLGEQLKQEFLDKLEVRMMDTALLDAYEYMQRYAVGLEQIAWDQEDFGRVFLKQFKDVEYNLRSVLCELQMALAERGVTLRTDISREVMSREFRDMSKDKSSHRDIRDWLIFRDYMNGLEYVIGVFEHLVGSIKS